MLVNRSYFFNTIYLLLLNLFIFGAIACDDGTLPLNQNSLPLCSPADWKQPLSTTETRMGTDANGAEQTQEATPENVEALLEASRYDDIDDVISLASSGTSLDSRDLLGRTALHMASANGHLDIVDYLIRNGVDINASNIEKNTPLHWACLNGHIEVVKRLILAGASVSALNSHERTPMDEAVNNGKMDVVDAINTAVAQVELGSASVSNRDLLLEGEPLCLFAMSGMSYGASSWDNFAVVLCHL
ncbi:hypothetical protein NMG60_11033630 [Bertholletia excelsa]